MKELIRQAEYGLRDHPGRDKDGGIEADKVRHGTRERFLSMEDGASAGHMNIDSRPRPTTGSSPLPFAKEPLSIYDRREPQENGLLR
jgi:hypothetical protein